MVVKFGRSTQNIFDAPSPVAEELDIYAMLGEPDDANSAWKELKFARYLDYDYMFISRALSRKLVDKVLLNAFMNDISQLTEGRIEKTKIFIYTRNAFGQHEFCTFTILWRKGTVVDITVDVIKDPQQKTILRKVFSDSRLFFDNV